MVVFARVCVALVWLYNGLWCKVLGRCGDHLEIIASVAGPLGLPPRPVMLAIGAAEVAIALWVMSGRRARAAAWVQTLLLASMNGAGLLFGGVAIERPGGLLVHNLVLVALVWLLADCRPRRDLG